MGRKVITNPNSLGPALVQIVKVLHFLNGGRTCFFLVHIKITINMVVRICVVWILISEGLL